MSLTKWAKKEWKRIVGAVIGVDRDETTINIVGTFPKGVDFSVNLGRPEQPDDDGDKPSD